MWPYWLFFALPLVGALSPSRLPRRQGLFVWTIVIVLLAIGMGLRDEVGGDWHHYLAQFQTVSSLDFMGALRSGDPGYSLVSWAVAGLGGDLYAVNLVCALVLLAGTARFCRVQQKPWLALLVAVPYLLVVVGMGYTRQSVAVGLAMLGLVALGEGRVRAFVAWVAVAALFHKTAVLLVPIAALSVRRNRMWTGAWVAAAAVLMYWTLLQDDAEALWRNYVEADMESEGGMIRVAMNVVPALLLIIFRKRIVDDPQERRLWVLLAILALACVPFVSFASTAVDRMALYLIPLQMYVFSRLHRVASGAQGRTVLVLSVIGFYAAVLWVWLNYATHALYWLPYKFMPLS